MIYNMETLKNICSDDLLEDVILFTEKLRRSSLTNSYEIAVGTVKICSKIICTVHWENAKELMNHIRKIGIYLVNSQPSETCVCNMVRKILKIVREEYASHSISAVGGRQIEGDQESLHKMVSAENQSISDYTNPIPGLKDNIIDSISELLSELDNSAENISQQAEEHIHANEVIMTMGKSVTVTAFLKRIAKKRKFQVIVAECAPFYEGHETALNLANCGIETTVITDSAIFAMMSRVNKVIIGTHTVMANGGLKAVSGSHALALAAKHFSVPILVCAAMFKFSPEFLCSYDQDSFNKFVSPNTVLDYSEGSAMSKAQVINPVFDYVPPELITLFISNIGGNSPSYVYRLLSDLYDPKDYVLDSSS